MRGNDHGVMCYVGIYGYLLLGEMWFVYRYMLRPANLPPYSLGQLCGLRRGAATITWLSLPGLNNGGGLCLSNLMHNIQCGFDDIDGHTHIACAQHHRPAVFFCGTMCRLDYMG
ncbi:MAG TPA: hypothetical protein EYQ20_01030 [candidate division Zixibacteria bacterium]|nr:hypothetical protein [candidate division Zixibacteria bacterium]